MDNKEYFGKDLEAMSFAENYHNWILDEFSPYLGENVAEVGAGTGNFSDFLLGTKVRKLAAFEPSKNMFDVLQKRFLDHSVVDTINAFFEDQSFPNAFDSVCYVNVLEHIEDDFNALSHAHKALHQNGHLLIFVPALPFLYSDLDKKVGHFRRYKKQQLENLVSSAGFTIKKSKYFDIAGIIPWYIAFVLLKQTTTEANVSLYDKLIVPVMRRVERVIIPMIGKNLILIAQKN